ncbi:hypothetical protein JRQ81_003553 [Phrynocephalus forsythii]|uniref:Uncharacterized protein n=1 Tax=Phrynocephalus forsythii TaxID=171643 RepID=A0A9Q0XKQ3_9SAUR|nr:hypothetical protein JRQ81_003553 [Phrynocephalus forsythii]
MTERCDRILGKSTAIWTDQHIDRKLCDMIEGDVQKTDTSKGPHLTHVLETNVEDPQDQVILCKKLSERLNVQMQDQTGTKSLKNDDLKAGLLDSAQGPERRSSLQTSISEKKTEKPNSFFMCIPGNERVDDLEKRQLSVKSFICPVIEEILMLAEERIINSSKNIQSEAEHPSSLDMSTEQNKAIQVIIGEDDIKEANFSQNDSRTDVGPVECMATGSQKQSNFDCTSNEAREGSLNSSVTDQFSPYKSEKTEERNNICNSTGKFEDEDTKHSSTVGEKTVDQQKLQIENKPVIQSSHDRIAEQSSPCRREEFVRKQHIEGQCTSGKDSPNIQSVPNHMEKETNLSEQNCQHIIATSNLLFPEPDGGVQSDSRGENMKVSCTEKSWGIEKTEMTAASVKSTIATLDPKVPILPIQEKENGENLLSNVKQLEFSICDQRPGLEAMPEKSITQLTLTNISMTETKTKQSVPFFTNDSFKDNIVICEENKNNLESSLSSVDILPVLMSVSDATGESATDSEAQSTLRSPKAYSSSNVLDTMGQISTSYTNALDLDQKFLLGSELQGTSERYNLECSAHKDKTDQPAAEQSSTKTLQPVMSVIQSSSVRDEVIPEDATDVVCGLIKELSSLK